MLFYSVLLLEKELEIDVAYRSWDDCCHDVAENTELEQKSKLDARLLSDKYAVLPHLVNQTESFKAVSHQLRQVVVKVPIQEFKVFLEIRCELFNVEEDLPEPLFYQSKNASEFNVAEPRNHEIRHRVVLVSKKNRKFCVTGLCQCLLWCFLFTEFNLAMDQHAFH